jgi:hypothetical protein
MAAWARIEFSFYVWFEFVADLDLRLAKPLYYSAVGFRARMRLIRSALAAVEMEQDVERFLKAALGLADDYVGFRNKLAHGEFTIDGLIIEGKHASRFQARAEGVSITELRRFTTWFNDFAMLLLDARELAEGLSDEENEPGRTLENCIAQVALLRNDLIAHKSKRAEQFRS